MDIWRDSEIRCSAGEKNIYWQIQALDKPGYGIIKAIKIHTDRVSIFPYEQLKQQWIDMKFDQLCGDKLIANIENLLNNVWKPMIF